MKWLVQINSTNDSYYCRWIELGSKSWTKLAILDFVLTGPLLSAVIFCGVLGNLLCILTFARFLNKLKIYRHLLVLALWDTFYIITSFFLYNLPTLIYNDILQFGPYVVTTPILYYVSNVARTGSIWTVLVIAFDRYFALCYPFRFIEINGERKCTMLIAIVGVCSFIYGVPRFFEVEIYYCYEIITKHFIPVFTQTKMRSVLIYWLLYRVIGGGLFYSVVPFLTLLFLNIRMLIEIKRLEQFSPVPADPWLNGNGNERVPRLSTTSSTEKINHWMHVAMITKFLICHSFPTILDIWELAQPSLSIDQKWYKSYTFMSHSAMLLATLNGSCNFFIYYITSFKFRNDCRACLGRSK